MRHLLAAIAALVLVAAAASGCGRDPQGAVEQDMVTVDLVITAGMAKTQGERVEVAAGQPVELVVKSDGEGEIHVHSDPEHHYTFEPGTTSFTFTVDRPGVVDVELHDPETLLAQLEVR